MQNFKSFMLGVGTAFLVYYITKKDGSGKSLLDEILENPSDLVDKAKEFAVENAVRTLKEVIK